MNITHAVHEEVRGDRLEAIFQRQRELWSKYHPIEVKSGLRITEDCPVNLDDRRGQFQIKDYAWRVMEEVGEAIDAMSQDREHFHEELIDGLHFLTELTIMAGYTPQDLTRHLTDPGDLLQKLIAQGDSEEEFAEKVTYLVEQLGMMCNCLKNKPWKQSMMTTDRGAFTSHLRLVWIAYINLIGLPADDITDIYLRKSQVNQFRQRSNY